jgi:hypothetical protein
MFSLMVAHLITLMVVIAIFVLAQYLRFNNPSGRWVGQSSHRR